MTKTSALLVLLLVVLAFTSAFAQGTSPPPPSEQFFAAALNGDEAAMKRIREAHPGEVDVNFKTPDRKVTALMNAAGRGDTRILEILLKDPAIKVNAYDDDGKSALSYAAQEGQADAVFLLLQDPRVNVNHQTKIGMTPFILATMNGHTEVVLLLIANERVDVSVEIEGGFTAFFVACQENFAPIVQAMLADRRFDVNKPDDEDRVSPFFTACVFNCKEVADLLMADPRVDLNQPEKRHYHPFTPACQEGHFDLVVKLLEHPRVDLRRITSPKSPLSHMDCLHSLHLDQFPSTLAREEADIKSLPFHLACTNGDVESVKEALKSPQARETLPLTTHLFGHTAAWLCVLNGQVEVLRELVNNGENLGLEHSISYLPNENLTPLNLAKKKLKESTDPVMTEKYQAIVQLLQSKPGKRTEL